MFVLYTAVAAAASCRTFCPVWCKVAYRQEAGVLQKPWWEDLSSGQVCIPDIGENLANGRTCLSRGTT